jgi:hypothetical protein
MSRNALRLLAGLALVLTACYWLALRPFALPHDPKLQAVLTYRHYGALLPYKVLWYLSLVGGVLVLFGLIGIILGNRFGRWLLLAYYPVALFTVSGGGLSVMNALPRTLGGIASIIVLAILILSFSGSCGRASNNRMERAHEP